MTGRRSVNSAVSVAPRGGRVETHSPGTWQVCAPHTPVPALGRSHSCEGWKGYDIIPAI